MANDVSYFRLENDATQYSFNDADLSASLEAEITRAQAAENANASAIAALNNSLLATTSNLDALINQTTRGHLTHYFLSSATGAPVTSWNGYVETLVESTGYAAQWAYLGSGRIYVRSRDGSTVGDWIPVYSNQTVTVTDINVNSKNIQARLIGNVCYVSGWVTPKAQSYSSTTTALVKLSVAPPATTFFLAVNGSSGVCYGMNITTAGNIVFNNTSPTFTGNPFIYFNFSYIVG